MKLFKEAPNKWAGRAALDPQTDIDIEHRRYKCGKAHTIINICRSYCREGILMDWSYDNFSVSQWEDKRFMGSDRIQQGHADLFSFTGQPNRLHLEGGPWEKDINLEFE